MKDKWLIGTKETTDFADWHGIKITISEICVICGLPVHLKRGKSGLKSIVLWGAFVSAVLAGLSATVGAALAGIGNKNDEMVLKMREMTAFDPFTLKTVVVTRRSEDDPPVDMLQNTVPAGMMKRPPIRIPYRPAPRSPFRPPLAPAATSHWRE